jgi:hypothetical protein
MAATVTVGAGFNGPRGSGNGGYVCGLIAAALGGQAEVSLRNPVPLDKPLDLVPEAGDGAALRAMDGERLIAEARRSDGLALDVPEPVGPEEARAATAAYRGRDSGPFSQCFVCGRARDDSFGVFAGEVTGRDLVASPWTPPAWTADGDGRVRPEFVWAALDCPTYFAAYLHEEQRLAFLVRDSVEIQAPVPSGEELVAIAWPLRVEGRKRFAGSALLAATGEVLASCEALILEPREAAT